MTNALRTIYLIIADRAGVDASLDVPDEDDERAQLAVILRLLKSVTTQEARIWELWGDTVIHRSACTERGCDCYDEAYWQMRTALSRDSAALDAKRASHGELVMAAQGYFERECAATPLAAATRAWKQHNDALLYASERLARKRKAVELLQQEIAALCTHTKSLFEAMETCRRRASPQ